MYTAPEPSTRPRGIVSIHDLVLHVLGADQQVDLRSRRPITAPADASE
jgi:hypothetical protein